MSKIGHNSEAFAPEQLKQLVSKIEHLEQEKRELAEDIKKERSVLMGVAMLMSGLVNSLPQVC